MLVTKRKVLEYKEVIDNNNLQNSILPIKPSGKGTIERPYLIDVAEELLWLSDMNSYHEGFGGTYFQQTSDINMNLIDNFNPIGNEKVPFMGSYNGNMKKIIDLTVKNDEIDLGLFGTVERGEIKNILIEDITINSSHEGIRTYVGGITGSAVNSEIINCHVLGSESGHSHLSSRAKYTAVGGITGYAKDSIISQCSNVALIETGTGHKSLCNFYAGGIAGAKFGGGIENCYNHGTIGNTDATAGLMIVAGIVGIHSSGDISCCYNIGSLNLCAKEDSNSYFKGGIVGMNDFDRTTFANNYYLNTTALKGIWLNQGNVRNYIHEVKGKSADILNMAKTYDGWNVNIWNLVDGSYPTLKNIYA